MRRALLALVTLAAAGCDVATDRETWRRAGSAVPNEAGLVSLPCDASTPLEPTRPRYCREDRHWVTPRARAALLDAASAMRARHPGEVVRFMDASGPDGVKPFPPHLSHGDGRQIDLGLYYTDVRGRPLATFPTYERHGGYWPAEPPRPGEIVACPQGRVGRAEKPDPPADRPWRWTRCEPVPCSKR